MRRTALVVPIGVAAAALLLIAAASEPQGIGHQPNPYAAIAWLSAVVAFGAFAVMLAE
jgi:ABC-type transport system involved in cytochrome bd biosynthesis fused ATPase/permease subunit